MIKIKETKSVKMVGDETGVEIVVGSQSGVFIPMKSIFQIQRGITSYIQKLYRKKINK